MSPGVFEAFWGGVGAFFSVWQLCILQITPFFVAFFVATHFILRTGNRGEDLFNTIVVGTGLVLGLSIFFGLLMTPGLAPGTVLLKYLKLLRFVAGIFIILVALTMVFFSFTSILFFDRRKIFFVLSPLVGSALAIAYSPCIPPALSRLLNYARIPENTLHGFVLLVFYALGIGISLIIVGYIIALTAGIGSSPYAERTRRYIVLPLVSSLIFMIIGILLVTGLMLSYKAFLVNLI